MFQYRGKLARVIDGDTIVVDVDLGFYLRQTMTLRLAGINTAEIHGDHKARALEAKAFVEKQLSGIKGMVVQAYKGEKYGRFLADVYYSATSDNDSVILKGTSLNQALLDAGLATRYYGKGEKQETLIVARKSPSLKSKSPVKRAKARAQ